MKLALVVIVALAVLSVCLWVKLRGAAGVKSDISDIGSDAKNVADQAKAVVDKVKC